MPLAVTSLETPEPLNPDEIPENCLDCDYDELIENLRDEWLNMLDERYNYGKKIRRLINHWTAKDYEAISRTGTHVDSSDGDINESITDGDESLSESEAEAIRDGEDYGSRTTSTGEAADREIADVLTEQNIKISIEVEDEGSEEYSEGDLDAQRESNLERSSGRAGTNNSEVAGNPTIQTDNPADIVQKFNKRAEAFLQEAKQELMDLKTAINEARKSHRF